MCRDEPLVEIQPSWASWQGNNIKYVFRGYDWDTIESWKEPGERATWKLDVLRGGQYEVEISYGRSAGGGGTLRLTLGEQALQFSPPVTPTADVFERLRVGTLRALQGDELMRLNSIFLRRLDASARVVE